MRLPPSVTLVVGCLLPMVVAWGAAGHEIIATIAQIHLHPSTRQKLCDILPTRANCHLASVASWADQVRRYYPETAPMHYINQWTHYDDYSARLEVAADSSVIADALAAKSDHPSDHCEFGEHGWLNEDVNVLTGIMNFTARVMAGEGDIPLRFLVHFMGDMHQPLHLTGRDKGGNGAMFLFEGHHRNLHSVWDSGLLTKKIRELGNYTSPLPSWVSDALPSPSLNASDTFSMRQIENALPGAIFDPYVRWIVWEGIRQWWRSELSTWLSCPATGDPYPHSSINDIPPSTPRYFQNGFFRSIFSTILSVLPAWYSIPFQLKYPVPLLETHGFAKQHLSHHPSALNATRALSIAGGASGKVDVPACPFSWALPLHQLNCHIVWPPAYHPGHLIELDSKEYMGRINGEKTVEKLMAMAGIRLASIMNTVFGDKGQDVLYFADEE